jgi:hypothetical protein
MVVTPTSRRWPLSFSTPIFGLFSALVVFLFSFVYLTFYWFLVANIYSAFSLYFCNGSYQGSKLSGYRCLRKAEGQAKEETLLLLIPV